MLFKARQRELAQRGQDLQARSGLLRESIAQDGPVLRPPLAAADQVLAAGRWLKAHPEWVGLGVALLVISRPRRIWWLSLRLWSGWRLWQRAQRWQATAMSWRTAGLNRSGRAQRPD